MTNCLIVHPGYHKTGTTWIQKEIFPKMINNCYLGKNYSVGKNFDLDFNIANDPCFWEKNNRDFCLKRVCLDVLFLKIGLIQFQKKYTLKAIFRGKF